MPEYNAERRDKLPDGNDFPETVWAEGEPIREYIRKNLPEATD